MVTNTRNNSIFGDALKKALYIILILLFASIGNAATRMVYITAEDCASDGEIWDNHSTYNIVGRNFECDTAYKHSGSYSLKALSPNNDGNSSDSVLGLYYTDVGMSNLGYADDVYVRYWARFPSDIQCRADTGGANDFVTQSMTDGNIRIETDFCYGWLYWYGPNGIQYPHLFLKDNQWHEYAIYFKTPSGLTATDGIVRLYRDGNLYFEKTNYVSNGVQLYTRLSPFAGHRYKGAVSGNYDAWWDEIEVWDGDPETPTTDTYPPYVSDRNPANLATGISTTATIERTFVDPGSNLGTAHSGNGSMSLIIEGTTYYCDSGGGVTCFGDVYSRTFSVPGLTFSNDQVVDITAKATDSVGNVMTDDVTSYTVVSGGTTPTVAITTYASGDMIEAPSSASITVPGTYTGTPTSLTAACVDMADQSACPSVGSVSYGSGTFSVNITLPTAGWGSNLVSNGDFANSSAWTIDPAVSGNWAIAAGVATYTDGTSAYGLQQPVDVDQYSWYKVSLDISGTYTNEWLSQYGWPGEGNSSVITSGSVTDMVRAPSAPLRLVASCTTEQTLINDNITQQQKGALSKITITAQPGGNVATVYINHFTAGSTASTLFNQWPYYDESTPIDSTVVFTVANIDTTPASASIDVNIAITGQAGIDYDCADTGIVVCTSYAGEQGTGWDVTITPAAPFVVGTEYTVTVNADNLVETAWTFNTIRGMATAMGASTFSVLH